MKLLLWGAGAQGRVVHDLAGACGYNDIAFLDDRPVAEKVCRCFVLSPDDKRVAEYKHVIISQGDNRVRARCFETARARGLTPATLIHPSAVVSPSAVIGAGTIVMPLVVVGAGVTIGEDCILNTACIVEHDSYVGDHVHISLGSVIGGEVTVGAFAYAGMGTSVLSRLRVGSGAVIGAGAVAVGDVAPGWIVVGIPARPLRENATA